MYDRNEEVEQIVNKYSKLIYRIAFLLLNSKSDAEDIVQEVFIKYLKNNIEFNDEQHEKCWIIKVTQNCCKDLRKSAWMRKKTELKEEIIFENESEDELYEMLQELNDTYRIVLQLFYYEKLSIKEISNILNISEGATKVRLNRARNALKKLLKGGIYNG